MPTPNINELLQLLDASNNILISDLTYSSLVEDSVKQNGGTVVYTYNNIIVATDISETFYTELQKNPNIDYIESLALKQYGEVDIDLINKLDNSGSTNGTDGVSGNSGSSGINGIAPTILNSIFTLSALTGEIFDYTIITSGTTPIDFSIVPPVTYDGVLTLNNINVINGQTSNTGVYNIKFLASNDYGVDTKDLILTINEPTEITNTNLNVYTKTGTQFYYTIEATGVEPKTYSAINLPVGLNLTDNMISGTLSGSGIYSITLTVDSGSELDSKTLTITAGDIPIITSSGQMLVHGRHETNYIITSTESSGVTYNVIGTLPSGLSFSINKISGTHSKMGKYYVTLKATNYFGESTKQLKILIYP